MIFNLQSSCNRNNTNSISSELSVVNTEFASHNSSKKTNTVSIIKDTEPRVQTQASPNYQHIILRLQKLQSFIPTNNAQTPHNPQNLRNFNTIFEWDRINWRNFKTHVTHRCEGVAWTLSTINIDGFMQFEKRHESSLQQSLVTELQWTYTKKMARQLH